MSRPVLFSLALASSLLSLEARADVQREGSWPADERKVSLDLERVPLRLALRRLSDAAGWSVVLPGDLDEPVDVQVRDQPADRVLELLLLQDRYVAYRTGDLLQVRRASSAAVPTLPVPPTPPVAPAVPAVPAVPTPPVPPTPPALRKNNAEPGDRSVLGGSARVERGEVVHHLTVLGGDVDIEGTVTGDVSVMGGSVRLRRPAHVQGALRALGGSVTLEEGVQVDGALEALGGKVDRSRGSRSSKDGERGGPGWRLQSAASQLGSSLSSTSLLFVFGAVVYALMTGRVERLQAEVARRPMRTFAVGVVGLLASLLALVVLCVTLIGIPVALVVALALVLATYTGVAAVLQTAGKALLAHRTSNPYVHLALGCLLLFVVTNVPWVGKHAAFVVILTGLGAALTTGLGGLTRPLLGANPDQGPYRTTL